VYNSPTFLADRCSVLEKPPSFVLGHVYLVFWGHSRWQNIHALSPYPSHHRLLSVMPFKSFSLRRRTPRSRTKPSEDQTPARGTIVISDPAWPVDMHDEDITLSAIQTSLAVLMERSTLASKLPFIAPIASLLLQALTMRDEVKQYKEECEIVMHKLARIARIIVNVGKLCENNNLSEEDLPASLRAILSSLQRTRELNRIERVLRKCSKRKGIKGILLRKDLLTKIKQCDVELSNVLQAFQAELSLDTRVALIVMMREAASDSGPIEAVSSVEEPNRARIFGISYRSLFFFHPLFNGPRVPAGSAVMASQSDFVYMMGRSGPFIIFPSAVHRQIPIGRFAKTFQIQGGGCVASHASWESELHCTGLDCFGTPI